MCSVWRSFCKRPKLDSEQREYLDTITQSGKFLLSIIDDILDFSKMGAGKMSLEIVPCDLRQICRDVVRLLSSKAIHKGPELTLIIRPCARGTCAADAGRIRADPAEPGIQFNQIPPQLEW